MDEVVAFLRDNAEWIFGSGGVAALVLALVKAQGSATAPAGSVRGDVVGRDKVTRTGVGGLEIALVVAVAVAALGGVLWLMGPATAVTAEDCSAAVQGGGNTVTVGGAGSCD